MEADKLAEWKTYKLFLVSNKSKWTDYRQKLRDVPAQSGFPNSVTWPTEPS